MLEQTIPVVDLNQFLHGDAAQQRAFVTTLGDALVEYGFVAVDHHGVDRRAIEGSYAAIKGFFGLPDEVKRRYIVPDGGGQRGYTAFGQEHAKGQTVADLKEFWHVGPELAEDHPLRARIERNVWPTEITGFRDATLGLWNSLYRCGEVLLRAIARYLDADELEFVRMIDGGNSILRTIRYPGPDEVKPEPGAVWAAAHEDINLITLLVEASDRGLELLRRDGTWLAIEPIPGQCIADAGDMLQRLTNGVIPSTTHRVLAPQDATGPRYSMPFFIHPHPDYVLSPLPSCMTEANPRRWPDITAEGYLTERLREIGLIKTPPEPAPAA